MPAEELVILVGMLLIVVSVPLYYVYRIARNDWVIDLKRWNLLSQFRQGRRDSNSDEELE